MSVRLDEVRDGALLLAGLGPDPVAFSLELHCRVGGEPRRYRPLAAEEGEGAGPLELRVSQRSDGGALTLWWTLLNRSRTPVLLDSVALTATAEGWPMLREPSRLRLFQHGYQSWTPSASIAGHRRPAYPRLRSFALMNHHVDSPLWGRKDGLISSLLTLLGTPEQEPLLMGFTTQRAGLGELFLRNRGEPALRASLDYGGKRLEAGAVLEGERLRIARGQPLELLEAWAAEMALQMRARVPERSPVGWCSWYQYYTGVGPGDLLDNAVFLSRHPELGVSFVQLDDGYQPAVGDWLERNDKFAGGLEPLASQVRELGFEAGIWTAPFMAAAGSRLFAQRRDWFLHRRGRPVATGFNPEWRARTYALDTSHPEARAWLEETFAALVAEGFDYHKIDFLFAGLRHGDRHDPSLSPLEAYRRGLEAIRSALGPDRFLLGCGAPLGPSVGLVDGMRVSQDVKEQWDSWLAGWAGRGCGYPAARGALRSNMTRWFMHRSLWVNDPDCLLVREHDTRLTLDETRTLVSVLGATGGMLFLSDDLPRVSADRLEMAAATLPPSGLLGRPSAPLGPSYPQDMVVEGVRGQRLVLLINWGPEPAERELPQAPSAGTWFDFWAASMVQGPTVLVPRHGVRALRFVPDALEPRILGDTLHLTAAVEGRLTLCQEGDRLCLVSGPLARRRGALILGLPLGRALAADHLPAGVDLTEQEGTRAVLAIDRVAPWRLELSLQG
jgi:alpha-galactosidase